MFSSISHNHTSSNSLSPRESEGDDASSTTSVPFQAFLPPLNPPTAPLHSAPSLPSSHPLTPLYDPDMSHSKDKHQSSLDIILNSDVLCIKGTGRDVDPALLAGHVALYLNEPTSLKHITLQFRGKAKLPASQAESIAVQSSQITFLVCNHEWSFLEGDKGHSHTLKAGRHLFPFQLHLGGTLPASMTTTALGGASICYKLRATAARSGFSFAHRELHMEKPVTLMRSLGAEALEFQQTLEIENTWPEKLMYSIMIPHKAWPAGDRLTAVVKFSPLVKGARVLHVITTLNESTKMHGRTGVQESTRAVLTTRHDFIDGQAVLYEEKRHRYHLLGNSNHASGSRPPNPSARPPSSSSSSHSPHELSPLSTTISAGSSNPSLASSSTSSSSSGVRIVNGVEIPIEIEEEPSQDVFTTLSVSIPKNATPTQNLEPIQVSHRIRWSIIIANPDGHTSELRCSLPLQVLDHKLFDEARAATLATRRLILGAQDIDGGSAVGTHGESADFDVDDDMELPSYPAHVRDRVANAFMPEAGVLRVTNPWVAQGVSPVLWSEGSSGRQSPLPIDSHPAGHVSPRRQLPANPSNGGTELDWVNSELLMSLTQHPEAPPSPSHGPRLRLTHHSTPPNEPDSGSSLGSRRGSRTNSRAGSPERSSGGNATQHSPGSQSAETFLHSNSTASRHSHGLFHMSMRPFASLANGFGLGSRNSNHQDSRNHHHHPHGPSQLSQSSTSSSTSSSYDETRSRSGSSSDASSPSTIATPVSAASYVAPISTTARPTTLEPTTGPMLLHRAFTQTPDYEMASRGFLGGGVPPLDIMRALPSYEDAAAEARTDLSRPSGCETNNHAQLPGAPAPAPALAAA